MKIYDLNKIGEKDVSSEPLFTGQVHTQPLLEEEFKSSKLQIVNVKFNKGARNKFHTHSEKQILFVIEGKGIVADRQKEYTLSPGMAVVIPAGEDHWHGAAKGANFAHLSMIGQPQIMKISDP
jgi:quercetin dioxygenase-like cupin family protein